MGSGGVRTSSCWVAWSSFGEGSWAGTAPANDGREAGWIIVGDLLDYPGISPGEWPVATCEEGVRVLQEDTSDLVAGIARQLLTAELNLTTGTGTCAVKRELIVAARAVLADQQYDGSPVDADAPDYGIAESMARGGGPPGPVYHKAALP